MRVLYVDDDRINALLFEESCRVLGGVEVETAFTGAEALACVAGWQPELLVIDLHLPDTNGFALLQALWLEVPPLAQVPAYLCTADDAPAVGEEARTAGFRGCWPKPASLDFLRTAFADLGHPGTA
jgi:two-component system, OmpR family, response regulator